MDANTGAFDVLRFKSLVADLICVPNSVGLDSRALWSLLGPALDRHPHSPTLHILIGDCLELGMDYPGGDQESHDFYVKAQEIDPLLPDAYTSLGHYFRCRDDNQRSCKYLTFAAGLDRRPSTLLDLATAHLDADRLGEARKVLSNASELLSEFSGRIDELESEIAARGHEQQGTQ